MTENTVADLLAEIEDANRALRLTLGRLSALQREAHAERQRRVRAARLAIERIQPPRSCEEIQAARANSTGHKPGCRYATPNARERALRKAARTLAEIN